MTLIDLIFNYFGRPREVHGGGDALNQCVDLANSYIQDVLGLPIITFTDAKDFLLKGGDKYDVFKNTPTNFPQFGDIVVWKGTIGGGHGHVAVCLGGDINTFVSYDENWSISQRCTIERHNYDNVDGWLRPKDGGQMLIAQKLFAELVGKATEADKFKEAGFNTAADAILATQNLQKRIDSLSYDLEAAKIDLGESQTQLETQGKRLASCLDALGKIKEKTNFWLTYLRSRGEIKSLATV